MSSAGLGVDVQRAAGGRSSPDSGTTPVATPPATTTPAGEPRPHDLPALGHVGPPYLAGGGAVAGRVRVQELDRYAAPGVQPGPRHASEPMPPAANPSSWWYSDGAIAGLGATSVAAAASRWDC
jgi:hypothetical protein